MAKREAPKSGTQDPDTYSISDLPDDLPRRRPSTCETVLFGKIRHWKRVTPVEWVFLALGIASALALLAFTAERLARQIDPETPDFTFALLLILNAVFGIWYLVNGLFREDFYEIGVFLLSNLIVLGYVIINYVYSTTRGPYKLARLCVSVPLSVLNLALGVKIIVTYWNEKHLIFAIASGNEQMTRICLNRFFCGTMLVFDLNFHLNLLLMVLKQGTEWNTKGIVILAVGIVVSFSWAVLGYFALRTEIVYLAWLFWALCLLGPAYVVYQFVQAAAGINHTLLLIIYVSGSIAIVIRLTLIVATVFAYRTFGRGYKERRYQKRPSEANVQINGAEET